MNRVYANRFSSCYPLRPPRGAAQLCRPVTHKCYSRRDDPSLSLSLFHQIFLFQVVQLSNRVSSTCRAAPRIGRSFLYRKNIPWIGYGSSWKFVALNKLLVLFLSRVEALTSRVDNFIILFAE